MKNKTNGFKKNKQLRQRYPSIALFTHKRPGSQEEMSFSK